MSLIGAVLGDIAGTQYEFPRMRPKDLDWQRCDLFTDRCYFSDDSVMSIATKYAIDNGVSFQKAYRMFGNKYPNAGYGGLFDSWLTDDDPKPYKSFGNGSAMRVSYVADKFNCEKDIIEWATESAGVTHNHPEGIKGAVVTAMCAYMAKSGATKTDIYNYAKTQYPEEEYGNYSVEKTLDEIRSAHQWNATCQGSVGVAIKCFLDSEDYKSCLRNVFSIKCDMDTLCSIAGGIAEAFYGTTGMDNELILKKYLDSYLLNIVLKT